MTTGNNYRGINHIVHISTDVSTGCEHCHFSIGGGLRFAESINHYIEQHGYKLLHVGAETTGDSSAPWHTTVAVVGK